jgi:hypothetical protein
MADLESAPVAPRRFTPKIVGGIDFTPPEPTLTAVQSKRKSRSRGTTGFHTDGLPIIDPTGEEDEIFRFIAEPGQRLFSSIVA